MNNVLGLNIKKFRNIKGITQEELGNLIGVTTQAVSKWERGGMPDAELLPSISSALDVSIDSLFGNNQFADLETMIIDELSKLDEKSGFDRAFLLCWAIEMGLTGDNLLKYKFTANMVTDLNDTCSHGYFSKLLLDNGLVSASLSHGYRYFFLMPEPDEGYAKCFDDINILSDTFSLFSDKRVLSIIFYMYQRKNTAVSSSLISLKTGVSEDDVIMLMKKLSYYNLADCNEIQTDREIIYSYTYKQECSLLPLLCYAKELGISEKLDFVALFNRDKPLF